MYVCIYVCMYICVNVCTYVLCMYLCMYVYMYVRIYLLRTYVCMYLCNDLSRNKQFITVKRPYIHIYIYIYVIILFVTLQNTNQFALHSDRKAVTSSQFQTACFIVNMSHSDSVISKCHNLQGRMAR